MLLYVLSMESTIAPRIRSSPRGGSALAGRTLKPVWAGSAGGAIPVAASAAAVFRTVRLSMPCLLPKGAEYPQASKRGQLRDNFARQGDGSTTSVIVARRLNRLAGTLDAVLASPAERAIGRANRMRCSSHSSHMADWVYSRSRCRRGRRSRRWPMAGCTQTTRG